MLEQDQLRAPYVRVVDGVSISDLTGVYGSPNDGAPQLMRTLRRKLDEQFRTVRPMYYQVDRNCWLHLSRSPRSALCIYLFSPMAAELLRRHELILLATPILLDENETKFWQWELSAWDGALDDAVKALSGKTLNFDVSLDELVSDYLFSPRSQATYRHASNTRPTGRCAREASVMPRADLVDADVGVKRARKATTRNEVVGEWRQ